MICGVIGRVNQLILVDWQESTCIYLRPNVNCKVIYIWMFGDWSREVNELSRLFKSGQEVSRRVDRLK